MRLEQNLISSVAVFVDGDNVRPESGAEIRSFAQQLGRLDVVRVYGGAHPASAWMTAPGYRFIYAGAGKNAADLLLSIDAMEMLLLREIRTFVVASSDGDFSHLAQRLRERGARVLGFGEEKTPESFRAACSEFSILRPRKGAAPCKEKFEPEKSHSKLDEQIRRMIVLHSKNGQGMRIAELAPKMHNAHGVMISSLPEGTWRAYLSKRPALYELDPRGQGAKVRFVPEGFR